MLAITTNSHENMASLHHPFHRWGESKSKRPQLTLTSRCCTSVQFATPDIQVPECWEGKEEPV